MVGNGELHSWDSQAMKVIEIQIQRAADEKYGSSLTLKDVLLNNYQTLEMAQISSGNKRE